MKAPLNSITEKIGRYTVIVNRDAGMASVSGQHHTLQASADSLRSWIKFYKRLCGKPVYGQRYSVAVQAHQRALELLEGNHA